MRPPAEARVAAFRGLDSDCGANGRRPGRSDVADPIERKEVGEMATQLCDIDGVRPAVASVRIRENGRVVTRNLCEVHLAEARAAAPPLGGGSLFDEFFSDFF